MMKLGAVGAFFCNTTVTDAYRSSVKFKGRLLPQDDNTRDSLSTARRALAVAAGTVVPTRRAIMIGGQPWVMGSRNVDYHGDDTLHEHYVIHRADSLVKVLTFEEALTIAPGHSLYAGRVWVKDQKEPTESAEMYPQYQFYMAANEDIIDTTRADGEGSEVNVLITMGGRWYMVRNIIFTAGGFQMALTDELPGPVVAPVDFKTKVYNRRQDTEVETVKTVNAVSLRWQSSFVYPTAYSPKYEPGDRQLAVLKVDITPQAGDTVKVGAITYKVVSKHEQGNLWFLHLSRP